MACLLPGKVTKIIDPHNFWMQIGTEKNLSEFTQFELDIEEYCSKIDNRFDDVSLLEESQILLVDCSPNNWRRGQVARIDRETDNVDILYIDYGDTELVPIGRLCIDFPTAFLSLPYQALHCSLTGISPIAKSWTTRGIKMFKDLTESKTFHTIVIGIQPDVYTVALYTRDEEEGISVTHILLDEEIGIQSEELIPPKLVSDAVPFFESLMGQKEYDEISTSYDANQNAEIDEQTETFDYDMLSPQNSTIPGIPTFDIGQIDKTKTVSSNVLVSKKQKQHLELQIEEAEKLVQQADEESAMAVMAGYGGKEDIIRSPESLTFPDVTGNIFADIRNFIGPQSFDPEMGEKIEHDSYGIAVSKTGPIRQSWHNVESFPETTSPHDDMQVLAGETHEDVQFMEHFNRILREFEKNNLFNWRLQMTELMASVHTIKPEELLDAITTLLRKAVRRYEMDHDIHLEILGMLNGLSTFNECLLSALGKVQGSYVKVNNVGTQYHVQYSKIIGYLYILCPTWNNCQSVCDFIHSSCEKWVVFNKRGTQLGQDKLQEIFLQTFEGFWEMSHNSVEEDRPEFVTSIEHEIKDKLLNDGVVRGIREQLLNILLQFFTPKAKQSAVTTSDVSCGSDIVLSYRSVACQTRKPSKNTVERVAESKARKDNTGWPVLNIRAAELSFPPLCDNSYKADSVLSGSPAQTTKPWSEVVTAKDDVLKTTKNIANDDNLSNKEVGRDDKTCRNNTTAAKFDGRYDMWSSIFKGPSPDKITHNKCDGNIDSSSGKEMSDRLVDSREEIGAAQKEQMDRRLEEANITDSSVYNKQSNTHNSYVKRINSPVDRPVFYRVSPSDYDKLSANKNLHKLANDFLTKTDENESVVTKNENVKRDTSFDLGEKNNRQKDISASSINENLDKVECSSSVINTKVQNDTVNKNSCNSTAPSDDKKEFDWFNMQKAETFTQKYTKEDVQKIAEEKNQDEPRTVINFAQTSVAPKIYDDDSSDNDTDDVWTTDSEEEFVPKVIDRENEQLEKIKDSSFEKSGYSSTESSASQKSTRSLWIPGKRKCTLCGDANHLIYDCPEKHKRSVLF